MGIILPLFHANQSPGTSFKALNLLFRHQWHEHMCHERFFLVNMKLWCLFSRSLGISLESWHLEQLVNSDGVFHIFCHANCVKRYVAILVEPCSLCKKCSTACSHNSHAVRIFFCGDARLEGDR